MFCFQSVAELCQLSWRGRTAVLRWAASVETSLCYLIHACHLIILPAESNILVLAADVKYAVSCFYIDVSLVSLIFSLGKYLIVRFIFELVNFKSYMLYRQWFRDFLCICLSISLSLKADYSKSRRLYIDFNLPTNTASFSRSISCFSAFFISLCETLHTFSPAPYHVIHMWRNMRS